MPVTILCPLRAEARLLRATRAGGHTILVTGPGDGPARWIAAAPLTSRSVVVLAGVAGALPGGPDVGEAFVLSRVLRAGSAAKESRLAHETSARQCCGAEVAHPLLDARAKRELHVALPSAALVDCESYAFAEAAHQRGVDWIVVRGVSDGAEDSLPADASEWINDRGALRPGRLARSLLRHPSQIRMLPTLASRTRRAMSAVDALLAKVLESHPEWRQSTERVVA